MKIDAMDIYELLKEENQRFWDFLDIEISSLSSLEIEMTEINEIYTVEAIETI